MVIAGLAMMVLALAALVMVVLTPTDEDQDHVNVKEPVTPERDGLDKLLPVG
jgi:hypothetical protein